MLLTYQEIVSEEYFCRNFALNIATALSRDYICLTIQERENRKLNFLHTDK